MNYHRVVPRDLFNEASLLKCHGQLYLNLDCLGMADCLAHDGESFKIRQSPSDGSIHLANVSLFVRGELVNLSRPLNSRDPYPLWATTEADEVVAVFQDDGSFTAEFIAFLQQEEDQ